MAFDEEKQATTVEHKVNIARRAHKILTEEIGFDEGDIIFDPNILTVATGIEEHNDYAINFIEATRQIKELFPRMFQAARYLFVSVTTGCEATRSLSHPRSSGDMESSRRTARFIRRFRRLSGGGCCSTGPDSPSGWYLPSRSRVGEGAPQEDC
jgi:hypothetical protein